MLRSLIVCGLLAATLAGQENITLRSGNGTAPGPDAQVTFVAGPFPVALVAADFAAAAAGAPAQIIPQNSFGWMNNLGNDPAAQWIGSSQAQPQLTALFAIPFTVVSPVVGAASLDLNLLVDDFLGDTINDGVFINGQPIPGTATTQGGTWNNEVQFTNLDVGTLVTPGVNYLFLYGRNTGGPGGLNFHADFNVYASPEWQVNQPAASLDIDGSTGSPIAPAVVERCVGETSTVNFGSTNVGLPWDLAVTAPEPGVSATTGGLVYLGEVVNINLAAASLLYLNNLTFTTPFPGNFGLPVSVGVPIETSAQLIIANPGAPAGIALSGLVTLDTNVAPVLTLTLPDDGSQQVFLSATPLCTGNVAFYGTSYSDLYVNSNGDVSFTAGSSDFTATALEWQTLMPRIGVQADLEPNNFGTVSVSVVGPSLFVTYANITEWGTGGSGVSSWTIEFNGPLAPVAITNFATDGTWGVTPCVGGMSLGAGGTHPALVSFDAVTGAGIQTNAFGTDSVIEENPGGMLGNAAGWTSILFPVGDGSNYIVN